MFSGSRSPPTVRRLQALPAFKIRNVQQKGGSEWPHCLEDNSSQRSKPLLLNICHRLSCLPGSLLPAELHSLLPPPPPPPQPPQEHCGHAMRLLYMEPSVLLSPPTQDPTTPSDPLGPEPLIPVVKEKNVFTAGQTKVLSAFSVTLLF